MEWYPPEVGENRFARWLEGNVDWALSRERYWGTPLNIWTCESCNEKYCIGGVDELRSISEAFPEEFDLHRPFIDDLDVGCPECGGRMRRVPEVIDCWFDSGSMPFAQYHYPMEHMDLFHEQYPADFISEGVDQSRGWFYSLLVIGAFLTKQSPYRRVLPHGMILDVDAQKMSKSRGNAVFASDVLKVEGADALRWYLIGSGAPYLPKRFDPNALKDLANKFLGTFRNLYNFYALYAGIDRFEPAEAAREPSHLLDRWILSRFNSTVGEVTEALDRYELNRATRVIQGFVIDELSNWYLRRSRRRFWKNEMSDDKLGAYETFSRVLEGVAKLTAPLIPFLSEAVFLGLRHPGGKPDGSKSVHLEGFPAVDESSVDRELERRMAGVLQAVTTGRAVRNKAAIKVRTPLAEMLVHSSAAGDLDWLGDSELAALVADELNVKKITAIDTTDEYIKQQVKPDFAQLGKRLGKQMKNAAALLGGLSAEETASFVGTGEISIELDGKKEIIKLEEVQILQQVEEGFAAESEGGLTVVLDTRLTPELLREGMARDIINRIQNFRKESGLEVSDRIVLSYEASGEIGQVFEVYGEHICSETLAEKLEKGEKDWHFNTALTLEDAEVRLWMKRV